MKGDTLSSGRSIGQFPPPGFGCSAERVSLTRSDRCQTWKFSFHEYAGQTWDSSSDGWTSAKSFSWMSRNLRELSASLWRGFCTCEDTSDFLLRVRGGRRAEHLPLQIYGGLTDGCPLGAMIKPSIWFWGCLITQPDPQSETATSLETDHTWEDV